MNRYCDRRWEVREGVILSTGVVLGPPVRGARELQEAQANAALVNERGVEEIVADKGYHSNQVLVDLHAAGIRTYIPEPERGARRWDGKEKEQQQVYANRRRTNGRRGKDLQELRSELTERSFAHMYESGGMRRTHLQKRNNILKRLLFHAVGFQSGAAAAATLRNGKTEDPPGDLRCAFLLQIVGTAFCPRWIEAAESYEVAFDPLRPLDGSALDEIFRASTTGC